MKPHEETWMSECGDIITSSGQAIFDEGMQCGSKAEHEPRLALAVQAPAMARLLLKLQSSGCTTGAPYSGCDPACPSCQYSDDHAPDCELATVLRAAGVLP